MSDEKSGLQTLAGSVPPKLISYAVVSFLLAFALLALVTVLAIILKFDFQIAGLKFGRTDINGASGHPVITAVPEGAVVAFVTECPASGWRRYEQAASRMIVGAATTEELESGPSSHRNGSNGKALTQRPLNQINGTEAVTLQPENLPAHNHSVRQSTSNIEVAREATLGAGITAVSAPRTNVSRASSDSTTGNMGAAVSVYNMPPYVALYYCEKLKG